MFGGSLYNVYMLLFHTHNVGLVLYYVYVDEAMSEDLLAHIYCNYCMYFIVQMSEINPGHFHSTWCCVVALRKQYYAEMSSFYYKNTCQNISIGQTIFTLSITV